MAARILREAGISVTEVAARAGVTRQTVSRHLTGRTVFVSDRVYDAIYVLASHDTATRVTRAADQARHARRMAATAHAIAAALNVLLAPSDHEANGPQTEEESREEE